LDEAGRLQLVEGESGVGEDLRGGEAGAGVEQAGADAAHEHGFAAAGEGKAEDERLLAGADRGAHGERGELAPLHGQRGGAGRHRRVDAIGDGAAELLAEHEHGRSEHGEVRGGRSGEGGAVGEVGPGGAAVGRALPLVGEGERAGGEDFERGGGAGVGGHGGGVHGQHRRAVLR